MNIQNINQKWEIENFCSEILIWVKKKDTNKLNFCSMQSKIV
jgi:hypothetical protein